MCVCVCVRPVPHPYCFIHKHHTYHTHTHTHTHTPNLVGFREVFPVASLAPQYNLPLDGSGPHARERVREGGREGGREGLREGGRESEVSECVVCVVCALCVCVCVLGTGRLRTQREITLADLLVRSLLVTWRKGLAVVSVALQHFDPIAGGARR